MCLRAKIDNQEFWAFYHNGAVELRDEHFSPSPLPIGPVLVKDEIEPDSEWRTVSTSTLTSLAKERMTQALHGLKNLSRV